jgi:hypothetical protein
VSDLVQQIFLRLLSRPPSPEELDRFAALLTPGYDARLTGAPPASRPARNTKAVSWANHLNPEATNVVLAVEKGSSGRTASNAATARRLARTLRRRALGADRFAGVHRGSVIGRGGNFEEGMGA